MDEEKVVPAVKTLQNVIDELHRVFDEDSVDIDYVKALLESYCSRSKDWRKYVNFDAYRYTRNLVDEGNGKFNLMLLCWGEGHSSPIHDHSDAHCFVKILAGQLKETIYDWPSSSSPSSSPSSSSASSSASSSSASSSSSPSSSSASSSASSSSPSSSTSSSFSSFSSPSSSSASTSSSDPGQPMQETDILHYTKDQVTYINDSMGLHRVENPSHSDRAISLHLYSPPFGSCNLFDVRTGQSRQAHMTFWSRKGQLEVSDPDLHESALQPRPLRGLLSKIGC